MSSKWPSVRIGDLIAAGHAQLQTGPFGSQLHKHDYVECGVPVIPTEAIGRGFIRTDCVLPQVSEAKAAELGRHRLQEGDILFARRGIQATGLSAIVGREHVGCLCGTGAILLRVNSDVIDPGFLSTALASDSAFEWLRAHAVGAVMPNLNTGIISQLTVPNPSLAEQRSIAALCQAMSEEIALAREVNSTLEAIAQAIFKSWFIDFDPVKAKSEGRIPEGIDADTAALFPDSFEESALGAIPKGWSVAPLGNWLELVKGCSYKGDGLADDRGAYMFNLGCFNAHRVYASEKVKRYVGEYRERHAVVPGDLIIANTDMTQARDILGRPAFVPDGFEPGFISHHVFKVLVRGGDKAEIDRRRLFLFFALQQDAFRQRAIGFATGTTVLALPQSAVIGCEVALPSENLLKSFDAIVRPMLECIRLNEMEASTLSELRDTLLPRLISGKLKLPELQEVAEAL